MRYFIVYLSNDEAVRYQLRMTRDGTQEILDWDSLETTNLLLQASPTLQSLKEDIIDLCEVGDYVLWWPELRIRTASVISSNGQFRSAHNGQHVHAVRSLLRHRLAVMNVYSNFTDEMLGFSRLDDEQLEYRTRMIDPWAVRAREARQNTNEVATTAAQFNMFRGSSAPQTDVGSVVNEEQLARIVNEWSERHTTVNRRSRRTPPPLDVPEGYRQCRVGEIIYCGYAELAISNTGNPYWHYHNTTIWGKKVSSKKPVIAPINPLPQWIRKCASSPAHRYLDEGEMIQADDCVILGDRSMREVSSDSIGCWVTEGFQNSFLRHIGVDGWRYDREGVDDPQDGSYNPKQYRGINTNASWVAVNREHEVNFRVYEYRRLVPGYEYAWSPSSHAEAPLGYLWLSRGQSVTRRDTFVINQSGHVARILGFDDCWFSVPVDNRFLVLDRDFDWDSYQIRASAFSPTVELISSRCSSARFSNGVYWVLSRFGLTPIYAIGNHGYVNTGIGCFYPTAFRINGKVKLIFCSDQLETDRLSNLLRESLCNVASGLNQLTPITFEEVRPMVAESLDRQVEL